MAMFGNYLCGGDCIEDVMDIKPFWGVPEGGEVVNPTARTPKGCVAWGLASSSLLEPRRGSTFAKLG